MRLSWNEAYARAVTFSDKWWAVAKDMLSCYFITTGSAQGLLLSVLLVFGAVQR